MSMREAYEERIKQLETRVRAAEAALDVERTRTKNLADTVIRLISQREKVKDLFDEAFGILANQPGLDLEVRQRVADLFQRSTKTFRTFGQ